MSAQPAPAGPEAAPDEQKPLTAKDDAAFRTIGEAAAELGLKTHVLRFWETKFEALAPLKRADGRRYYRPEDMEKLRTLKQLLHVRGLTIRGAIRVLSGEEPGADDVEEAVAELATEGVHAMQSALQAAASRGEFGQAASVPLEVRDRLDALMSDLERFKTRLDGVRLAS